MLVYLTLIDSEQEKDKFTALYGHYRYTMLHCAIGIVHDHALAEDVVHNSFIKIISILDKFEDIEGSKSKNLIVTIVKHKAIDLMRREKRIDLLPPEEMDDTVFDTSEQPDEAVINRQSYERLLACILRMDDNYRIILGLKYFQQFSNEEIAQVLDITRKNAETRLYRAKKKLIGLLKEEGILSAR